MFQCTYAKPHVGDSVVPGGFRCTDLNTLGRQGADLFACFYPNHKDGSPIGKKASVLQRRGMGS